MTSWRHLCDLPSPFVSWTLLGRSLSVVHMSGGRGLRGCPALHSIRTQRILRRGLFSTGPYRTVKIMAQIKILCHDKSGCISVFRFYTHEFTRGWALGSHSGLLSAAAVDSSGRGVFPLLGDSASKDVEAVLFFLSPTRDSPSSSSSSSSSEEGWALESSDFVSEAPR